MYRLTEHVFIGMTAAHVIVLNYENFIKPNVIDGIFVRGEYIWAVPFLLGMLIYTRYFRPISWWARIPMSLTVGYGVGFTLAFNPLPFLRQVTDTFIRFQGATTGITINNILFFVMTIAGLVYFFFTIPREKYGLGHLAALGRYTIVIALGASYGNTVQGRFSLFLGRLQFLLRDWLSDTVGLLRF